MSSPTVTLHVFCSAKGGVGKSTLAVACAKLLAQAGRQCVLIDADLTGTSLADGLRLCAPVVRTGDDGQLDFFAPPTGQFMSRAETDMARNARYLNEWRKRPPAPPYLNDILIQGERDAECRVESLWWKHEQDEDGVRFLPSSPLKQDIAIALGWFRAEPFDWLHRFMWLLQGMREQLPSVSEVVIDLPPGLFGFGHETLALLSNLETRRVFPPGFPEWNPDEWKGKPYIVTTEDRNDFVVALEYWASQRVNLPHLNIILNRATQGRSAWFFDEVDKHFGPAMKIERARVLPIDELKSLRELFISGGLHLNDEVQRLREYFLGGSHAHSA
jgi:hypothetical protein